MCLRRYQGGGERGFGHLLKASLLKGVGNVEKINYVELRLPDVDTWI
jgi:hypothetical protein